MNRSYRHPFRVARAFANNPRAGMVVETMGHAYGEARFAGRCPLSGAPINRGDAIRHVVIWTRDGSRFEGHILNHNAQQQGMAAFQFVGVDAGVSTWHPGTANDLLALLDDETVDRLCWMTGVGETKQIARDSCPGRWGRNQSVKQVAARIRRTNGIRFIRVRRDGRWGAPFLS